MKRELLANIKMPKLHILTRVEKNGIILHENFEVGHSWTINAYHAYNIAMVDSYINDTSLYLRDTSGNFMSNAYSFVRQHLSTSSSPSIAGYFNAGNNLNYGVVIGIGDTPFHLDDYRLETYIAHGNSADTLFYQGQGWPVITYTGDPDYEENTLIKRVFNNNSGATITVKEVGLVYYLYTAGYLLMSRDVIEVPTDVPNGAQLTVTISITTQSLEAIHSKHNIALGAAGSGGYYMGWYDYTPANQSPGSHRKYGLILSPVVGGQSSALKFRDPGSSYSSSGYYYGAADTNTLIGFGAASPIGEFVTAANAAVLGGYSDWYIPANYESARIYTIRASIPAGQECDNAYYWTSSPYGGYTFAWARNPLTNAEYYWNNSQTNAYKVRLIRRILLSAWAPA